MPLQLQSSDLMSRTIKVTVLTKGPPPLLRGTPNGGARELTEFPTQLLAFTSSVLVLLRVLTGDCHFKCISYTAGQDRQGWLS